jgi:serine/alanine adding enzyme
METTAAIEIKLLTDEEALWDQYVQGSSDASLYHLSGWKRVVEQTFRHHTYYLYAWQDNRIVGILPLIFLKSLIFGKFFVSLPYFNYGGIVADTDEICKRLLEQAVHLAQQVGAKHIELRHLVNYELNLLVKTSKVLMVLDLPATSEELWDSFKSKLRSQIKRPEKEGFTVKFGHLEAVESFYEVFAHSQRDLGTPVYTKRLFANILCAFPEQAKIFTVYAQTKPIASGFLLGFKQTLQIPWAGSLRSYNRFGVNMLLYWSILKFACEQGYTHFDFGRSTIDEGTYKFKEQWGAQPVPCYWHYWLPTNNSELPELNPHNPKYQLAIRTWKRLPVPLTKWLGPHIVKFLP